MFDRSRRGEHALLIHPHRSGADPDAEQEFNELARSAGAEVVASLGARLERPNPATLIGSGKVEEAKLAADASGADLVLVDHQLSPVQERNLEKALGRRVVDRTGLILDIFALRARSHEGKLQVELAQLRHLATRLVRGWTHLERQRGGSIGLRGPGETQLETDRRLLQKRVDMLQKRLDKVEVQHAQMRRARERNAIPRVALVGYTNAGKSTLFNTLTGAGAYAADQLFATLDPTVRRLRLPGAGVLVLADTVGFVRDLPHELVAAFRSTLSEAREADLLLHLVDAADPLREERIAQVDAVLEEIGAGDLPQVLLFNKIDRIEGAVARHDPAVGGSRERIWMSAQRGDGLDLLRDALDARFRSRRVVGELDLPPQAGRLRARLHALEAVAGETAGEHGWRVRVDLPAAVAEQLAAEADGAPLRALLPAREETD
ncbi:ribosome rescue GTPase HflX [Coralloluteibacterium stylophorae]|uniref:GTPase HflX n=1 Tax=Coralloluteibacterium stylophorae TaxID=1776034 RepID=A0A8J7VUV0_9GAMM|nr:ribosome rescue GTPase HflX [Coralloluteibacterium stylophorae]MBS7459011.1 GTPase HflX [Coralloluteibacterium stylophorae]